MGKLQVEILGFRVPTAYNPTTQWTPKDTTYRDWTSTRPNLVRATL